MAVRPNRIQKKMIIPIIPIVGLKISHVSITKQDVFFKTKPLKSVTTSAKITEHFHVVLPQ